MHIQDLMPANVIIRTGTTSTLCWSSLTFSNWMFNSICDSELWSKLVIVSKDWGQSLFLIKSNIKDIAKMLATGGCSTGHKYLTQLQTLWYFRALASCSPNKDVCGYPTYAWWCLLQREPALLRPELAHGANHAEAQAGDKFHHHNHHRGKSFQRLEETTTLKK